jgi:hypothetical protein
MSGNRKKTRSYSKKTRGKKGKINKETNENLRSSLNSHMDVLRPSIATCMVVTASGPSAG